MKKFVSRLESNWIILLIVFISIPIHFAIRYWYYNDMKLVWNLEDTTIFNNLVTPLATILSVVGVFATLFYLRFQNKVILSQSIRGNYEHDFDVLRVKWDQSLSTAVYMNVGYFFPIDIKAGKDFEGITSNNFIQKLREATEKLIVDQNYLDDLDNKKVLRSPDYYFTRSYSRNLRFVLMVDRFPTMKFDLVLDYLQDVKLSELTNTDKRFFSRKVEDTFFDEYRKFYHHECTFEVPNIYERDENNKVKWIKYSECGIARFFIDVQSSIIELKNLA